MRASDVRARAGTPSRQRRRVAALALGLLVTAVAGIAHRARGDRSPRGVAASGSSGRIGVLLVSHGSRSARWREMLLDVEASVRGPLLALEGVESVASAFMEYSEPSIATRLRGFDEAGCRDVVVVPLLLTVSGHSFDDIPVICGQKEDAVTLATLRTAGVRVYRPRAGVHMAPLLDFGDLLETNVLRRVRAISRDPAAESVVLVAYGDVDYDPEWQALVSRLGSVLRRDVGMRDVVHAWCGHIVSWSHEPTAAALRRVLEGCPRALVVPLLVAVDEMFQGRIIGGAIRACGAPERVTFTGDAILPEPALSAWIVEVVRERLAAVRDRRSGP